MTALTGLIYSPIEPSPILPVVAQRVPLKSGRWSLYYLCDHCGTEWIERSDSHHASSECPICSKRCTPFEYGC